MAAVRAEWASARRIVIKIGSSLLADAQTGALNKEWLASLIAFCQHDNFLLLMKPRAIGFQLTAYDLIV